MRHHADLSPSTLLWAYRHGYFPMADEGSGKVEYYTCDPRTIIPFETFHVSHSLRRRVRKGDYALHMDTAFGEVVAACAQPRRHADSTWINRRIIDAYIRLHRLGHAHSVEAWRPRNGTTQPGPAPAADPRPVPLPPREGLGEGRALDQDKPPAHPANDPARTHELVGGLYGVALGGVFFGESMFSRATDASKVCLVHLVEHLRSRGYVLLDTQFGNAHMAQFGTVDIPRDDYLAKLATALAAPVTWKD